MLKGQQKDFADYLLQDPEQNATAAYRKAYPNCKSDDAAYACASRLLSSAKVQDYLDKAKAERSERTKIDADWLLTRLAEEAEADLADIYFESGALKPVHMWPKIWRQGLVAGVKNRQERVHGGEENEYADITEVKLADRNAKLKMIGDHVSVGAFKKDANVTTESEKMAALLSMLIAKQND